MKVQSYKGAEVKSCKGTKKQSYKEEVDPRLRGDDRKGRRKMAERRRRKTEGICEDCEYSNSAGGLKVPILVCNNKKGTCGRLWVVGAEEGCSNFKASRELLAPGLVEALAEGAKLIPLTQGKFAIVDAGDYEKLNQYKWYANKAGQTYYAMRRKGRKQIRMHRQILNAPRHLVCDHINHDGLDNRKRNLRLCTQGQNCRNKSARKGCSSKYIGVSFDKQTQSFSVSICVNFKKIWLGRFKSEIEAAKARDRKAIEVHGEFACLNFPEEWGSSE
jgi:hypothetical protein